MGTKSLTVSSCWFNQSFLRDKNAASHPKGLRRFYILSVEPCCGITVDSPRFWLPGWMGSSANSGIARYERYKYLPYFTLVLSSSPFHLHVYHIFPQV